MCHVNNERERNILGEEEDQIGKEPIRWRRRRKKKKESQFVGNRKGKKMRGREKGKEEREREDFPDVLTFGAQLSEN